MTHFDNEAYSNEFYVETARQYETGYNQVPVLPYIEGYFEQEKRMMNIGLNAYMGMKKIERHPEEQRYDKMWRNWCKNYECKQVGGENGTWAFHAHLGQQTKTLIHRSGHNFGQYWLDYVRIYLPSREGNRENKVKAKLLQTSYSLLENELNSLREKDKLPHLVLVYGNKVWDHGIIPYVTNHANIYDVRRRFRFCRITPKSGGHVTAFCRLSHPASFRKQTFYDVNKLFNTYQKEIHEILGAKEN